MVRIKECCLQGGRGGSWYLTENWQGCVEDISCYGYVLYTLKTGEKEDVSLLSEGFYLRIPLAFNVFFFLMCKLCAEEHNAC
ncbi:hypothetical protein KDI_39630 [Dictyobacter arantiisoli]|uniref:Uncharacterized protein n=1 Tax=Dictyobacter arantiisoli TaxID=2014874 RepID=A0A5A5TH96_9CHLR|nr:hypothetical protein KDI_39630 [Dictyobacter arantiisoli]